MQVRFNKDPFDQVPAYWSGGTPLQNYVLTTLSHMFPDGERFFIRSVKRFADRATDQKMQKEIKAFIGQEMQHGLAHERFNQALDRSTASMSWFMTLFTVPTFEWLEPTLHNMGIAYKFALGCTAAAENMTAGFAENVFRNQEEISRMREDIRNLFLWHAAEEMEHRHLAFDLLQIVDGSYLNRMASATFTYLIIGFYVVLGTVYLMASDKNYPWQDLPGDLWRLFTEDKALGKIAIQGFFDYARPDFHPNDKPIPPEIKEYLDRLDRNAA